MAYIVSTYITSPVTENRMQNLNDADFYYVHNSEQQGPVKLEELRTLKLSDNILIWYRELPNWKPLGELTELKEKLTPKGPPSLDRDSLWNKSWDLTEAEDFQPAIENWLVYVSIFPDSSAAHYNLGYCYSHAAESDLELKHRSRAVDLVEDPEDLIRYLSTKSEVHEKREEWQLARLDLSRALDTIESLSPLQKSNLENLNDVNLKWRIAKHNILCGEYRKAALFFFNEAESNFVVRHIWQDIKRERPLTASVVKHAIMRLMMGQVSFNLDLIDFQETSLQHNKQLAAAFHNDAVASLLRAEYKRAFKCLFYSLELDSSYQTFLTLYFLLQRRQAHFDPDFFNDFLLDNKHDQDLDLFDMPFGEIENTGSLRKGSNNILRILGLLLDYFDTPIDKEHISLNAEVRFTKNEGCYIRGIKWFISACRETRTTPFGESIYWSKEEFVTASTGDSDLVFLYEDPLFEAILSAYKREEIEPDTYTTESNDGVAAIYQDLNSNLALMDLEWSDSKKSIENMEYLELDESKRLANCPILFPFKTGPHSGFTTEASDVIGPNYPTGRNLLMFIDTETTGLPKDYNGSLRDFGNWPRVIQAAWVLTTLSGDVVSKSNFDVFPDGFSIPQSATDVHGITNEEAEMYGHDLGEVLDHLSSDLTKSLFVIGHNIKYDSDVLAVEYLRKGQMNMMLGTHQLCTMKSTVNFCRISELHGYKWPSLEELHYKLFESSIENAHDALNDVMATKDCFFELITRGEMSLKTEAVS